MLIALARSVILSRLSAIDLLRQFAGNGLASFARSAATKNTPLVRFSCAE
jgi:hypothetical protein